MHRLMLPSVTAVMALGFLPYRVAEGDTPFDLPLTPKEGRYLLDRADEKRWQILSDETEAPVTPVELEFHPETLSPELKQIQRALGGSVVDQAAERQGPSAAAPASSPQTTEIDSRRQVKIDALREAAWQLDSAAHRLESLDLFQRADALRDQARQLRLDARSMIQGQSNQPAADAAERRIPSTDPLWNSTPPARMEPSPQPAADAPLTVPLPDLAEPESPPRAAE